MNNKNLKVQIEQTTRQAIMNVFVMGHISEQDIHMIIKKNNIKFFN